MNEREYKAQMAAREQAASQGPPPANQRNPESLSGQQVQALAKSHADHLAAIKRDIELRKWAADQACSIVVEMSAADGVDDVVKIARAIHAFLVEGAEKAE